MKDSVYLRQARLLLRILPILAKESRFSLKGGTALNYFVRDMPRLSVDIDLTYRPPESGEGPQSREDALKDIAEALQTLSHLVHKALPTGRVSESNLDVRNPKTNPKLIISHDNVQVIVEPNTLLRGHVFPCEERRLAASAETTFEMSTTVTILSFADLYAGKLCAALDRQHPRDLYDIRLLLQNEGLTADTRKAFVVYLAGHNRPMHELLDPRPNSDFRRAYDQEFSGMALQAISFDELIACRDGLPRLIRDGLTSDERQFLLSLKQGTPDWNLLKLPGIETFPSTQWKLQNIRRMPRQKWEEQTDALKRILEI
jgi:predicted nucleotidyltransferase component of viral defense system